MSAVPADADFAHQDALDKHLTATVDPRAVGTGYRVLLTRPPHVHRFLNGPKRPLADWPDFDACEQLVARLGFAGWRVYEQRRSGRLEHIITVEPWRWSTARKAPIQRKFRQQQEHYR